MSEGLVYVNSYRKLGKLLDAIKIAAVPTKFTTDYLSTVLGFKSSSDRAFIPLLKRLGFLDQSNLPTERYKNFRDSKLSGTVMAEAIKEAYNDHFVANEFAHKLSKDEFQSLTVRLTGYTEKDQRINSAVGTFYALCDFANFDNKHNIKIQKQTEKSPESKITEKSSFQLPRSLEREIGLSYTINLNLPATTDIEVFNAIFKSLKEHLLDDK